MGSNPQATVPSESSEKQIYLVASGDLRLSANQVCWPAQADTEQKICDAFAAQGWSVKRAHPFDDRLGHGFIWNQRMGMDVFKSIPSDAPVIVAVAVWQYSYHVLAGLREHRGPILTVANWSGQWPGLVGMLNLNGSLTKMGVKYSTIWSEDFQDEFFINGIQSWIRTGTIVHDVSHVRSLNIHNLPSVEMELGITLARKLKHIKLFLASSNKAVWGCITQLLDDDY